jgi:uncharacterized membrane protein YraQ (UPF0718 family)
MRGDAGSPAATAGAGLGFLLAGVALLLQEMGMVDISWGLVLPAILITVGVVTALTGLAGAARSGGPGVAR